MIVYIVAALADFLLAGFVLSQDRGRTAVAFSLLCVALGVWTLELAALASVHDMDLLQILFHIGRVGMFFIGPLTLLFAVLITRTQQSQALKVFLTTSFAVGAALSLLNMTVWPSTLVPVPGGYSPKFDALSAVFYASFLISTFAAAVICVRSYRQAIFRERQRIKWIAFGVSIGVICGWIHIFRPKLYMGTVGAFLCLYFISYAVVRYRVINTRFAISESAIRLLTAILLTAVFVGFDQICDQYGLKTHEYIVAQGLVLMALLQAYPWLTHYFLALRDQYYATDHYSFDFTTDRVSKALKGCSSAKEFRSLCDEIFLRLVEVRGYSFHVSAALFGGGGGAFFTFMPGEEKFGLHPSPLDNPAFLEMLHAHGETLFYDEVAPAFKDQFVRLEISAIVPARRGGETIGFILLGAPTKAQQFSYNDIRLLNWFGSEVGPMFENLLALMRLESSLDEAEKTLSVVSRLNEYNHDIKTPFSNIEALLLAGDAFSAEERQSKILDQVRKGHALVSTMTGLLKGRHASRAGAFNLNDVIRRVVASFPTKAVLVETDLGALPCLDGYEAEMELLISNLLTNAFAAQDKPGHNVRIWTWSDAAGGRVGCSVQDNGRGIPKGRLPGIWLGLETTRRAEGGSGVGLGVVKRIIEAHGGTIVVSSEEGVGTEFTFSLPVLNKVARMSRAVDTRDAVNG